MLLGSIPFSIFSYEEFPNSFIVTRIVVKSHSRQVASGFNNVLFIKPRCYLRIQASNVAFPHQVICIIQAMVKLFIPRK